jgi:hypothetical protein
LRQRMRAGAVAPVLSAFVQGDGVTELA